MQSIGQRMNFELVNRSHIGQQMVKMKFGKMFSLYTTTQHYMICTVPSCMGQLEIYMGATFQVSVLKVDHDYMNS